MYPWVFQYMYESRFHHSIISNPLIAAVRTVCLLACLDFRLLIPLFPSQDTDFDSTGGLLGATIGRVKQLSRGSQTKLLCYMLLFCLFVFFVLYWFLKLRWWRDPAGLGSLPPQLPPLHLCNADACQNEANRMMRFVFFHCLTSTGTHVSEYFIERP